jgi:hypothetical protein
MAGTGNGGINEIIPWYKQKTTWVYLSGIVGALGTTIAGETSWIVFAGVACAAVAGICQRQGTEKSTYIPELKDRGEEVDQS